MMQTKVNLIIAFTFYSRKDIIIMYHLILRKIQFEFQYDK